MTGEWVLVGYRWTAHGELVKVLELRWVKPSTADRPDSVRR